MNSFLSALITAWLVFNARLFGEYKPTSAGEEKGYSIHTHKGRAIYSPKAYISTEKTDDTE